MTAPTPGWRPLPECPGCSLPVRRATADRNGGYCTACRPITPEHPQVARERIQLAEWQALAQRRGREQRQAEAERARKRQERR